MTLAGLVAAGSCSRSRPRDPKLVVSASIPPLGAIAGEVGGDAVEVHVVLPPGASPHDFEPGPDAVRALSRADVHLTIGRGLDVWSERLAAGASPGARIERLGHDLPGPEPTASSDEPEGDPHIWLDPIKAATVAERIGGIYASLRPEAADTLRARGRVVAERYRDLDRRIAQRLEPVREVPFVAFHGGLNHLVARYGLRQVALIEPYSGREPTPRYLAGVVDTIRRTGAKVVFSEPQISDQLARVVGRETGVPVRTIDLIGGAQAGQTYEQFLLSVVDSLTDALGEKR